MSSDPHELVAAAGSGDRRALARLITLVEDGGPGSSAALAEVFRRAPDAHRIGVTGAPGAGKSTLTDGLIRTARTHGETVGVLAVDPTSPFTGGAVLGDRVRMQDHALDDGVYVRSMASRGHLGGLSAAAPKALAAMEIAGFDRLFVETVGVGQDEVEIAATADTVVVVVTPGWGDGVQAAKAGILEIGDVFVVNKADRPGVKDTVSDLEYMLALAPDQAEWRPPIVETIAATDTGVVDVRDAIDAHRDHLTPSGLADARGRRRRSELEAALVALLRRRSVSFLDGSGSSLVEAVVAGEMDPWTAAEHVADEMGGT